MCSVASFLLTDRGTIFGNVTLMHHAKPSTIQLHIQPIHWIHNSLEVGSQWSCKQTESWYQCSQYQSYFIFSVKVLITLPLYALVCVYVCMPAFVKEWKELPSMYAPYLLILANWGPSHHSNCAPWKPCKKKSRLTSAGGLRMCHPRKDWGHGCCT